MERINKMMASELATVYGQSLMEVNEDAMMLKLFLKGEMGLKDEDIDELIEAVNKDVQKQLSEDPKAVLIMSYFEGKKSYRATMMELAQQAMEKMAFEE